MYYLTMYYLFGNLGILSQMESVERKGTFRVKRVVFGVFLRGILSCAEREIEYNGLEREEKGRAS